MSAAPGRAPARGVAIVGATATGKTSVAEWVADRLGGEVVCADSRQVFRELEIGTGKPTPEERARLPHHLFDALELGERASAGWFARAAAAVCAEITARGRVPVLVGGSGFYVRALMSGLSAEPPHDPAVRDRLREQADRLGVAALHARLTAVDPATAARLHPGDRQRVTRALEVYEASGRSLSEWHAEPASPELAADWAVAELRVTPAALDTRIAARTRMMFDGGLVEECAALVAAGRGAALRDLHAVGYDEALDLLGATIDREHAERRTNVRTRRLAKRQRTWFRHQLESTPVPVDGRPLPSIATEVLDIVTRRGGG